MVVLAALLLPQLMFAGVFRTPANPATNTSYQIVWQGSLSDQMGVYGDLQVQAPGSSSWVTIGTGVSSYYGACTIAGWYSFATPGVWNLRVRNLSNGSIVDSGTISVSAGLAQLAPANATPVIAARLAVTPLAKQG